MNTKKYILSLFENNREQFLSGEYIAEQLNISRNAVWKAVKELKKNGYKISAVTNKGYKLSGDCDILSDVGMLPYLTDKNIGIFVYPTLESTNITAKEKAMAGAEHGSIVIAETQTAGRGRYNRSFFSPPGGGIYMSFILKPEKLLFTAPTLITALAAVAVCEAVEAVSDRQPQVKWVNDVFADGKKICGILTEAVTDFESGGIQWIVLGIGINFSLPEIPENLRDIITSVFPGGEPPVTRNRLAAEVANRIIGCRYNQEELLKRYKQRLFMLGKKVLVCGSDEPFEATAVDIDEIGRLIVRTDNGEIVSLNSGEVSVKM